MTSNNVFETIQQMGWRYYALVFCCGYTGFSIYFTSYVWVLSNVFHFKIVGKLFGVS